VEVAKGTPTPSRKLVPGSREQSKKPVKQGANAKEEPFESLSTEGLIGGGKDIGPAVGGVSLARQMPAFRKIPAALETLSKSRDVHSG